MAMATTCAGKTSMPLKEAPYNFKQYPPTEVKYEDVVADPILFMTTLEKLHAEMGTKFMIPILGGKELNLHQLFVEVTSRGGIEKVLGERKWKEVTAVFNFPSTATNASFVLRKYYYSLLKHYEQLYFFRSLGWASVSTDASPKSAATSFSSLLPECWQKSPDIQVKVQNSEDNAAQTEARASVLSAQSSVVGVIDGKFESGYLVTVTVGTEKLKGVLYQAPQSQLWKASSLSCQLSASAANASAVPGVQRRRRRKKSEIKRRDPAHPKPNRSGYNFFFAEQHARLKPLHPGKDREISRMIGELWNKLKESDKAVYQEKAIKDKERYKIEMEDYRERLRTGQVVSDAMPLQQRFPLPDVAMPEAEVDSKTEKLEGESPLSLDNDSGSSRSGCDDDKMEEETDAETFGERMVDMKMSAQDGLELNKSGDNLSDEMVEMAVDEREENPVNTLPETRKEALLGEAKTFLDNM